MPSPHLLLIQTENAYDGQIQEKKALFSPPNEMAPVLAFNPYAILQKKTVEAEYFLTKTVSLQRRSCCVNEMFL